MIVHYSGLGMVMNGTASLDVGAANSYASHVNKREVMVIQRLPVVGHTTPMQLDVQLLLYLATCLGRRWQILRQAFSDSSHHLSGFNSMSPGFWTAVVLGSHHAGTNAIAMTPVYYNSAWQT